jgi:outer membrane biosynthesis protein TonB
VTYSLALVLSLLSASTAPTGATPTDSIRSDAKIRTVALRHAPDVRKCYETEGLGRNPNLTGSVDVTITILPTGAVSEVEVKSEGLKGSGAVEVSRCIETSARSWTFDRGPYVVESVILPFQLTRDGLGGPPGSRARTSAND